VVSAIIFAFKHPGSCLPVLAVLLPISAMIFLFMWLFVRALVARIAAMLGRAASQQPQGPERQPARQLGRETMVALALNRSRLARETEDRAYCKWKGASIQREQSFGSRICPVGNMLARTKTWLPSRNLTQCSDFPGL